jgi:hypothetical protein
MARRGPQPTPEAAGTGRINENALRRIGWALRA